MGKLTRHFSSTQLAPSESYFFDVYSVGVDMGQMWDISVSMTPGSPKPKPKPSTPLNSTQLNLLGKKLVGN
jgi:hypothetical protein